MFKLLIADDERWIRQGLLQLIDWQRCGIDEVWEAEDGGAALQKSLLLRPDIVIADVRMPDLDGLELCHRLREELPQTRVIIISGYQDFNYARRAVTLGVFDYIVKPLQEDNILATVQRCVQAIAKERQRQNELEKIQTQLRASSSLLQQEYLNRLLQEAEPGRDPAAVLDDLQELGLDMKAATYCVFVAEIDDFEWIKQKLPFKEQEAMKLRLLDEVQQWIDAQGTGLAVARENDRLYGCIGWRQFRDRTELESCFQALNGAGSQEFAIHLYVSQPGPDITKLPELREQAEQCQRRKFFVSQAAPLFYEAERDQAAASVYRYDSHREAGILEALRLGDRALLQQRLQELAGELSAHRQSLSGQEVLIIYEGLLEYVARELTHELGLALAGDQFTADKLRTLKELKYQANLAKASRCIEAQLLEWLDRLKQWLGGEKRKVIRAMLEYVATYYNQKISLASAAAYLHFNPSYLSKLFCLEVGESFTKHLMKVRIAKAKEILKNPSLRIYEVGDRVGYSDIKYFTKIFKELEGLTPGEYRERCLPNKQKS